MQSSGFWVVVPPFIFGAHLVVVFSSLAKSQSMARVWSMKSLISAMLDPRRAGLAEYSFVPVLWRFIGICARFSAGGLISSA